MLAAAVTVAGFEMVGHRRLTDTLLENWAASESPT